jgi:hypothetical protein
VSQSKNYFKTFCRETPRNFGFAHPSIYLSWNSMSLTLNTTGVTIVDDTNPGIVYKGTWITGGSPGEYDITTHGTDQAGSIAIFTFNGRATFSEVDTKSFYDLPLHCPGTSIAAYGTLGPGGTPITTYDLDNSALVVYSAPVVGDPVFNTLFYQSPVLSNGPHSLVITFLNSSGIYWLDYLLYMPSPTPNSSSLASGAATSSAGVPTTTHASITAQSAPVGVIVGGVLGGLLLLLALFSILLYYRYRQLLLQHQPIRE